MAFFNQFMSYFTNEEQKTDLVKLWATIGTNIEKTLLEEVSAQNFEMSDINNFLSDTYESWLAFFMRKIRNRVAPKCKVTLKIEDSVTTVNIPKGTVLKSPNGDYYQMESVSLTKGQTAVFTAIQGKLVTEPFENYSSYLKFRANNVDMDTITVTMNGVIVPEIKYHSSYSSVNYLGSVFIDNNGSLKISSDGSSNRLLMDSYGNKGDYYNVIDTAGVVGSNNLTKLNGVQIHVGDRIIYDGNYWTVEKYDRSFMPYQLDNKYGIPQNGFFAYYSDNYLYIKIFGGSDVGEPNGSSGVVTYISTDGIQGEVEKDTLTYKNVITDINENEVTYSIGNDASTKGLNEIGRGQLNMLLRQSLFTETTISSTPEYNTWFNAQPEIGSVYCYSDFDEYLRTGSYPSTLTGAVNIYGVDRDGVDIYENKDLCSELLTRIQPYKDIATITINKCSVKNVRFIVKYHSCTDDSALTSLIKSTIGNYFDNDYLREHNSSLFDDLNIPQLILDIGQSYSVKGLDITCNHYINTEFFTTGVPSKIFVGSNVGTGGGKYYFSKKNDDNTYGTYNSRTGKYEPTLEMWEVVENGVCKICGLDSTTNSIKTYGYRDEDISFSEIFVKGKLEVSLPTKEEGILTVGSKGCIRKIPKEDDVLFMKPIIVEKYSNG